MNSTPLQPFRSQSSSRIISIPTRHDPKSSQQVVLLKDILQTFEHVKRIMCGGATVLHLTDENFEYLIPARIAHYPGVVLDVVITDDLQDDSSSMRVSCSNSHAVSDLSVVAGSSSEATSVARDVASLMIRGTADSQALVVSPQGRSLETAQLLRTDNNMAQPKNLHPFELQMEELVGRIQQTDQKVEEVLARVQQTDQQREHAQQQIQDQIDRIQQTLQQMDRQHTELAEQMTQQLTLHKQQWEESMQTSQRQAQQYVEAVQQKIQQLEQNALDSRQQTQDIQQQSQQQVDKVLIHIQKLDEQAKHSHQQHEQLLQQLREMGNARQDHDHLSPRPRRQETQLTFGQFAHAQSRVQAVLAMLSPKLPIPRLFIILPEPTAIVDGQGKSHQVQFKLYFLCECGSHTMTKDCNTPHEVHLANHPGYDLDSQDEFINKYGPYLLAMMHMAKYGAKARGLVVPPLLGLNHAIGESGRIGQLIDDTISHLNEATGYIDGDTTAHQCLNATELTELKLHLKTKNGKDFSGGLCRMKIQNEHYTWICSNHLQECYDSTLQQLKNNISTSDSLWKRNEMNEVKFNVVSESTNQLLYDDLDTLFRIQGAKNWRSNMKMDLKRDAYQSMLSPTTDMLSGLDDNEPLSLDFGRFSVSVKDIFRGHVKDVAISIGDLSTLTLDDLEFIYQCRPTEFVILETPQKKDDNRLVSIIQHNINTLRIVCDMKRYISVVDLVSSTREKMLQSGFRPTLRMVELVHPEINVKVSLDEGSPALETAPCINLGSCQYIVEPAVYNSIRKHGWSAITFVVPESFSDRLAILMDEFMQETDSNIARLDITPTSLTTQGLEALSRVINQSQGLTYLRLSLESLNLNDQLEKALLLIQQHKDRLTSLRLDGKDVQEWLPRMTQAFPTKDGFPVLEEFFVESCGKRSLGYIERQWIKLMVSTRPQPLTPLKVFGVTDVCFSNAWSGVLSSIDLSTIEELHFNASFFGDSQLKILVRQITGADKSLLQLRVLDLKGTNITDEDATREMLARVQEKAPKVEIRWK